MKRKKQRLQNLKPSDSELDRVVGGETVRTFNLQDSFPSRVDSSSKNDVAIETITIAYEKIDRN